ncbi:MAG: protein-export chaperone SecB [Alphaproteobacteria bacterium]|nr:protein-export chaperone SecB [Alphaproteobacteria bacterium]
MTDETPPPAPETVNVQIGLGAQYIKDFSFESPNAPLIFNDMQTQPQMALDVNVMTRNLGNSVFEAVLKIKLESKLNDKTAFIAELAYAGLFTLPEMPEEQIRLFLLAEAPRLLFPFARAIISNAIREGGFPAITLQPIDFMALYAAQRDKVGTMMTVGAA